MHRAKGGCSALEISSHKALGFRLLVVRHLLGGPRATTLQDAKQPCGQACVQGTGASHPRPRELPPGKRLLQHQSGLRTSRPPLPTFQHTLGEVSARPPHGATSGPLTSETV